MSLGVASKELGYPLVRLGAGRLVSPPAGSPQTIDGTVCSDPSSLCRPCSWIPHAKFYQAQIKGCFDYDKRWRDTGRWGVVPEKDQGFHHVAGMKPLMSSLHATNPRKCRARLLALYSRHSYGALTHVLPWHQKKVSGSHTTHERNISERVVPNTNREKKVWKSSPT